MGESFNKLIDDFYTSLNKYRNTNHFRYTLGFNVTSIT